MIVHRLYNAVKPYLSTKTDIRVRQTRRNALALVGYNDEKWVRVVRRAEWHGFLAAEARHNPEILEISPELDSPWRAYATGSYRGIDFPDFDITRERLDQRFDVVIAEEVFEHLAALTAQLLAGFHLVPPGR